MDSPESCPASPAREAANMPAPFLELAWELWLLCQGLSRTRVRTLETVSTVVRLPADPAQIAALRRLCERLADEFGLDHDVRPAGDAWAVAFSRPPAPVPARAPRPTPAGLLAVRAGVARLTEATRRPTAPRLRPLGQSA